MLYYFMIMKKNSAYNYQLLLCLLFPLPLYESSSLLTVHFLGPHHLQRWRGFRWSIKAFGLPWTLPHYCRRSCRLLAVCPRAPICFLLPLELLWWPQASLQVGQEFLTISQVGAYNSAQLHGIAISQQWLSERWLLANPVTIRKCKLSVNLFFHKPLVPAKLVYCHSTSFPPSVPLPLNHQKFHGKKGEMDQTLCYLGLILLVLDIL